MSKKLILLLATCLLFTSCLFGCDNSNETIETTTTEAEVTTEKETTTKVEVTTEEPTTKKEPATEYVYKGKKLSVDKSLENYFNGLILKNGDEIHVNDLYSDDSLEASNRRGSVAYALLTALDMKDERTSLKEKYWLDGAYSPEIPYGDNYSIKCNAEKVEFVLVEKEGERCYYDVIVTK